MNHSPDSPDINPYKFFGDGWKIYRKLQSIKKNNVNSKLLRPIKQNIL